MTLTRAVEPARGPTRRASVTSRRLIVASVALLIIAAAAAVRLADLGNQPGGLYPDEAAEGVTASRILHDPGTQAGNRCMRMSPPRRSVSSARAR